MLNKKKLKEIAKCLTANRNDFISAFRQNMYKYLDEDEFTLSNISEEADMPYSTLKTFVYGNAKDANLSNAVKLSRALEVSIDELIGADTIPELSRESLRMCRELPENDLYLVRWFIRYLDSLNKDLEPNERYVSVMLPEQTNNGDFKITSNYEKFDISELSEPLRSKVFIGFRVTSENYMPHYIPGNTILLANDRPPKFNENCVVRVGKFIFITKRVVENGIAKHYSIRDGKYRIDESEIDELIGYIGKVI